jgi:hypothetical protein
MLTIILKLKKLIHTSRIWIDLNISNFIGKKHRFVSLESQLDTRRYQGIIRTNIQEGKLSSSHLYILSPITN